MDGADNQLEEPLLGPNPASQAVPEAPTPVPQTITLAQGDVSQRADGIPTGDQVLVGLNSA
jgi:hypothetical protein